MRKIVQLSTVTVFGALCFAASAAGATSSGGGVVGLLQKKYLVEDGTTLAGLMAHHGAVRPPRK